MNAYISPCMTQAHSFIGGRGGGERDRGREIEGEGEMYTEGEGERYIEGEGERKRERGGGRDKES